MDSKKFRRGFSVKKLKPLTNPKTTMSRTLVIALFFLTSIFTFSQEPDLVAGKALFNTNCASCHKLDRKMTGPALRYVENRLAEEEGLDKIFINAGFEWREPGCSMCLGMNPDQLKPKERCASTSNRNFEGRQGRGGRTHLVSPGMAIAAAVTGRLTDVRKI